MSGSNLLGILAGLAVIFLPYSFLKVWRSRHPLLAGPFAWGLAIWLIASGLDWSVALAFSGQVSGLLGILAPGLSESLRLNLAVALIYAVIETSLVLWLVLKSSYEESSWERALCFGLGYGAAECLVYGAALVLAWARPGLLPAETREAMSGMPALSAVAPLVERTFSYLTHIYAALAIFYGVRSKSWNWVGLSLGYKFSFYAVTALGWGLASSFDLLRAPRDLWTLELAILAFGALGLSGLLHLGYVYHRLGDGPGLVPAAKPEAPKKEAKSPSPSPEPA